MRTIAEFYNFARIYLIKQTLTRRNMKFNELVTRNRLYKLLGITPYMFEKKYMRELPDPILVTNNKIPLYALSDVKELHEKWQFTQDLDFTDYDRRVRHYNSEMQNYDFDFDKFTTMTDVVYYAPYRKQGIDQAANIAQIQRMKVFNVVFYNKGDVKLWLRDANRLDTVRAEFKNGFKNFSNTAVLDEFKTYSKWLNAVDKW